MCKHSLCLVIALFLIIPFSHAQGKWETGYVAFASGDTVSGLIEYRGSSYNSGYCRFRPAPGETIITYTPLQISSYKIENSGYFVSRTIEDEEKEITVFLEFLIEGRANLYHYKGERYYIEVDSTIYELQNTEKNVEVSGIKYVQRSKEYIGMLTYLLQDADIRQDIEEATLDSKSLIRLAKKYHETVCTDESCIIYKRVNRPLNLKAGLQAGISYSTIKFGRSPYSTFSPGYLIGLRLELFNISQWSDRFTLSLDPSVFFQSDYLLKARRGYSSLIEYNGEVYDLTQQSHQSYVVTPELDINLKLVALNLPLSMQYDLGSGKGRPFIGLGLVNMIVLSQNDDFILKSFHDEFGMSVPVYHLGVKLKTGYKFRFHQDARLVIEAAYQYTSSMNTNQFLRFNSNHFSLSAGYLF